MGTLLPLLLIIYMSSLHAFELSRAIHKNDMRAKDSETEFRLKYYKPNYWVTITLANSCKEETAIHKINEMLVKASRRIKAHIFWFGYFDYQPQRSQGGKDYIHFHLFLEVEGLQAWQKPLIERMLSRWNGDIDIQGYKTREGAIKYSVSKHEGHVEAIACPRCKNMCNKRGRVCAYVWKKGMFIKRHR